MAKIQEVLNSARSLAELLPIAKQLEAKLSFWGYHYVELKRGEEHHEYKDSAPIAALHDRIELLVRESGRLNIIEQFSLDENQAAGLLEHEITRIYSADKELFKSSCLFTKILSFF